MQSYTLNTRAQIPAIGLGTWLEGKARQLESVLPPSEAIIYVIDEVGYRLIDRFIPLQTNNKAWGYGDEVEVGNAIRKCKTPRNQVYVTVGYSPTKF
jgi:diketogulonate reductase-like aldo/keto reductase